MNPISVADLMHLSIAERIPLVEDLWDSIAAETVADQGRLALSRISGMSWLAVPMHTGRIRAKRSRWTKPSNVLSTRSGEPQPLPPARNPEAWRARISR